MPGGGNGVQIYLKWPMSASLRIPGPRHSLIGPAALRMMRNPPEFWYRIGQQYGDLALVRFGPLHLYFLNGAEYIKEVLVTRYRTMEKGAAFHMAKSILGEGLLTSDGEFHLRQRRLCQPAFHPNRINGYVDAMSETASKVGGEWRDGDTIELFQEMSRLTLTIAARALFGFNIEERTDGVREALTEALQNWRWRGLPLARLLKRLGLPVPPNRRLRRARAALDAIIYQIIQERRSAGVIEDDFLSMMVHAVDEEGGGGRMTDLQLRDEAMTFILAGHETMATTLTWAWYLISQHPEVERRLYAEVDNVLGGRPPAADDIEKLDYTRQVFAETLRLYPAFWIFSRRTNSEIQCGPYTIPAGAQILTSPYVTLRRSEYFPRPLEFDPDRFAGVEEPIDPEVCYFPFGVGVRRCIGEGFARTEGPVVLAALAQQWRLQLAAGQRVEMANSFILRPKHGMLMTLQQRTQAERRLAVNSQ